jgi:hypothetical protein
MPSPTPEAQTLDSWLQPFTRSGLTGLSYPADVGNIAGKRGERDRKDDFHHHLPIMPRADALRSLLPEEVFFVLVLMYIRSGCGADRDIIVPGSA